MEQRHALGRDGFQVRLRITETGDKAFRAYLAALRAYLEGDSQWAP